MIKLAYEMCIDNTSKLSFPYINKILLNWYQKGVKTPEDAAENEKNRQLNTVNKTFNPQEFDEFSNYTVPNLSKKKDV